MQEQIKLEQLEAITIKALDLFRTKVQSGEIEISKSTTYLQFKNTRSFDDCCSFIVGFVIAHGASIEQARLACKFASQFNFWRDPSSKWIE